jgi:glycosyltransferase involved in cell wall biosynthesis
MKPRILLFSRWFAPGYKGGGSLFAALNLVRALKDEFEFYVVTSNHDAGETEAYHSALAGIWTPFEGVNVRYLAPKEFRFSVIRKIVETTPHDLLHLNSAISLPFFLMPLLAKRFAGGMDSVLVTPHGEFSAGALAQKPLRKRFFLRAARLIHLYSRVHWQALAVHEEQDIRRQTFDDANISVIPPISHVHTASPMPTPRTKMPNELRVIFLSRIDRMKNLEFVIRMIEQVPGSSLDIYGPIGQPDYWQECRNLLARSPRKDAIRYCGSVRPDDVTMTLAQYDLFFLPSMGENFGYVLLEALAAGCPIITSDRTPWRDLATLGVGADLPLENPQAFKTFLESAVMWNDDNMRDIRSRARGHAQRFMQTSKTAMLTKDLYLSIINRSRHV